MKKIKKVVEWIQTKTKVSFTFLGKLPCALGNEVVVGMIGKTWYLRIREKLTLRVRIKANGTKWELHALKTVV